MMEKRNVVYAKPKMLRRICSAIIDFFLVLLIGVIVSLIISPIIEKNSSYKENIDIYNKYAVESGLYYYNDDRTEVNEVNSNTIEELEHFYYDLLENGKEVLDNKKADSNLYTYDEVTKCYVLNDGVNEVELYNFCNEIHNIAINSYFNKYINQNEISKEANYKISIFNLLELLISAFTALLIIYLILPLVLKEKGSIGKLMFKLKTVSSKGNGTITNLQIIFRGLVIILLEYLASIYTISFFYVPLFLTFSFFMLFISKNQLSFHDLVCSTLVVDTSRNNNDLRESEKIIVTYYYEELKDGK